MKKFISLILAAALMLTLIANTAFAADSMQIIAGNVSVEEGTKTVEVDITIPNNPGIATVNFNIDYDGSVMKLKKVTKGEIFTEDVNCNVNAKPASLLLYTGAGNKEKSGVLATLTFEIKDGTPAGKYDIVLSEKAGGGVLDIDENKVPYEFVNGSVTVTEEPKKDITGAKLVSAAYGYDGAVKSLVVKGTLPKGAEVTYENNSQSDAGVYDVTATIRAEGYNDKVLSAKLTINKKALTVTGLKAENKTYDGTADAVITGGTLAGAIKGDDVTVKMPEKGTFKSKDAAKGIAVSYGKIVLSGEKAKNYTLTQPALKADIAKASLTVKAEDEYIIKGQKPKLNYTVTEGALFGDDKLTGALSTKADGTKTGEFAITQGTLKVPSNYTIKFVGGKVFVTDRTPQNITVAEIGEKTYGDGAFKIEVTKDAVSNLDSFTFESSNPSVAEVSSDGTVTVKAVGEANITVKEAGNDEYAPFEKTLKLTVGKKAVTVTGINLDEKTAELTGLLEADTEVKLDFSKIAVTLGDAVDETTSNAVVKGFALTGAKAENYIVATESINATVKNENTVKITLSADKGTVTGAGTYLKGAKVTVTAAANSGYKFLSWCEGDKAVSADYEYTFTAEGDRELTAKFRRKSSGGGSSSSGSYKVSFESNGGSGVSGITVKKGQKIGDIKEPVKEGFVFGGWYSDKELTKLYDENAEVTASVTLYALWKVDPKRQIVLTIDRTDAKVFGEKKANDVAPVIKNERTMLPARFVAESLGAKVEWNGEAKTVTITKDETVIVITIGSDKATVNGKDVTLDSPAFIENNRTYTPIRFISENLGAEVEWDGETRKVTITK